MTRAQPRVGPHDVAVVGAGLAGTAAALRAQELGARTLLLERGDPPAENGNTRLSGGTLHAAGLSLQAPAEEIERRIAELTGGRAEPDVAHAYAANCARAVDWLGTHHIELTIREGTGDIVFAPQRSFEDLRAWRSVGAHRALVELQRKFVARGGTLWAGAAAGELVSDDNGEIAGVVVVAGDDRRRVVAPRVVLADGGFQANRDLLRRYIGPSADRAKLRGSDASIGDALRLAEPFGAKLVNMEFFYGHCLHRDALTNDGLWPMPIVDLAVERGVVVNAHGRRVADEGLGGIATANALARLEDPRATWVILDAGAWESLGRSRIPLQPHIHDLESRGGVVHTAGSLDELAVAAGFDVEAASTIRGLNEAVATVGQLEVPRSGLFRPVVAPPFRAIPLVPGITFTMGGLAIDGAARVLDGNDTAIRGLYAAGGSTGGLQGSPNGGYVAGLSSALVFGILAGEGAARERSSTPSAGL